jgi:MFS family permease
VLSPYRRILRLPGALAFSSAGFVARLPISMVSLGIVVLVSTRTGSYAYAGVVSAAYVIANAAAAPVQGRLTDRHGQHLVLPASITLFAAALAGLMVAVELRWPTSLPLLFAAVAGAGLPPVGSSVRARWRHAIPPLDGPAGGLYTAFALESAIDEAVFIVGPVVVTLLATAVHPMAGLMAAVLFGLVGTYWLATQQRTEPSVDRQLQRASARPPLGWRSLLPVGLAAMALGMLFGSVEVVTVAFAKDLGHAAVTGGLLAAWAFGSLLAGLITGAVRWRSSVARRFRLGMGAMALTMLPLPFIHSLLLMGGTLFLAGFAISPTLVASMSLVEATVPASRLTEGITWVMTGLSAGLAPGAAIAGRVVDVWGPSSGYLVPVAAGLAGAAIAAASRSGDLAGKLGRARMGATSSNIPPPEHIDARTPARRSERGRQLARPRHRDG